MLKQFCPRSFSKSSAVVPSRLTKPQKRGQTSAHFKSASLRQSRRTMASSTPISNEAPAASSQTFKFAAIQMRCTADKLANLENAFQLIKEASSKGAQLIALPVRILGALFKLFWWRATSQEVLVLRNLLFFAFQPTKLFANFLVLFLTMSSARSASTALMAPSSSSSMPRL